MHTTFRTINIGRMMVRCVEKTAFILTGWAFVSERMFLQQVGLLSE